MRGSPASSPRAACCLTQAKFPSARSCGTASCGAHGLGGWGEGSALRRRSAAHRCASGARPCSSAGMSSLCASMYSTPSSLPPTLRLMMALNICATSLRACAARGREVPRWAGGSVRISAAGAAASLVRALARLKLDGHEPGTEVGEQLAFAGLRDQRLQRGPPPWDRRRAPDLARRTGRVPARRAGMVSSLGGCSGSP